MRAQAEPETGSLVRCSQEWLDWWLMVVEAVGGVLVCGSLACAGAAVLRRRHRVAAALFAAALAVAAAEAFGADEALHGSSPAGSDSRARWRWSSAGSAGRSRLSWLDFLMGGCAVGALAVTTGAEPSAALAAAGVAAALGAGPLAGERRRSSCALVGLIALGELPALAAPLFGAAAWLTEPEPEPGPEFNPVVLIAILAYCSDGAHAARRRAVREPPAGRRHARDASRS